MSKETELRVLHFEKTTVSIKVFVREQLLGKCLQGRHFYLYNYRINCVPLLKLGTFRVISFLLQPDNHYQ